MLKVVKLYKVYNFIKMKPVLKKKMWSRKALLTYNASLYSVSQKKCDPETSN